MTDPQNTAPAPPPAPPTTPASSGPAMPGMLASMSRSDLFIAGGAALVILTDLVFVIFGPYSFSNVIWAAAAVALAVVLGRGRMAESMGWGGSRYGTLLSLLALTAFLVAIRELIRDLIFLSGNLSGVSVSFMLGMVGLYVGVGLMAFGAWQMWSKRSA